MKFALFGAAALAAAALVMPVKAQEVITNPGRCAQYYPDANCTNLGPGNPYTDGGNQAGYGARQPGWRNGNASMRHGHWHRRWHRHHHWH